MAFNDAGIPLDLKGVDPGKPLRILSIDGGGVRGIIPAMFLVELEKLLGGPIANYFDLIAGTSTGGFLTLLLTVAGPDGKTPKYTAQQICDLYQQRAADIFPFPPLTNGVAQPLYVVAPQYPNYEGPDKVFAEIFGNAEIKDAVADVLVTAYDMDHRNLFFFTRHDALMDAQMGWSRNCYMHDVARASTAFPILFPAASFSSVDGKKVYRMLDGGMAAINPVTIAVSDYMMNTAEQFILMSLGTGDFKQKMSFSEVCNWGAGQPAMDGSQAIPGWNQNNYLVNVMFDGMASAADNATAHILRGQPYYRFQVDLPEDIPSQDTRPATVDLLKRLTSDVISGNIDCLAGADGAARPESTQYLLQELASQLKAREISVDVKKRLATLPQASAAYRAIPGT